VATAGRTVSAQRGRRGEGGTGGSQRAHPKVRERGPEERTQARASCRRA
jgi:hypothetical protein